MTNEEFVALLQSMVRAAAPGDRLPTVRELIARFGVSQHLVQQALNRLSADGVIVTHVGRGTFVAQPHGTEPPGVVRRVLTLHHHMHYERGDIIAHTIHSRLVAEGHNSVVVTYNDAEHAAAMLRDGPHYDTCVLQPRTSVIPARLLGLLREISRSVIVESRAIDQMDVDAISNDPRIVVRDVVRHLRGLGHRRIALLVEDRGDYFYERVASLFEAHRAGAMLDDHEAPVLFAPPRTNGLGFDDLGTALEQLFGPPIEARPTAVLMATYESGARILDGFAQRNMTLPDDASVIRIGAPDIEGDHRCRLAVVGRPSAQAAETVLARIRWRWRNPDAPTRTIYDPPLLVSNQTTGPAPPPRAARRSPRARPAEADREYSSAGAALTDHN